MLDLAPWQSLLLAIAMPPLLVILAALGWQEAPKKSRWRGGEQLW